MRLVSSAITGVSVAVITLPFDNVKTKIMKMKKGNLFYIQDLMEKCHIQDFSTVLVRV